MTNRINSIARALFIAILVMNTFSQSVRAESGLADQVIVKKSERKLYLMNGDDVLQAFDIALGLVPEVAILFHSPAAAINMPGVQ